MNPCVCQTVSTCLYHCQTRWRDDRECPNFWREQTIRIIAIRNINLFGLYSWINNASMCKITDFKFSVSFRKSFNFVFLEWFRFLSYLSNLKMVLMFNPMSSKSISNIIDIFWISILIFFQTSNIFLNRIWKSLNNFPKDNRLINENDKLIALTGFYAIF